MPQLNACFTSNNGEPLQRGVRNEQAWNDLISNQIHENREETKDENNRAGHVQKDPLVYIGAFYTTFAPLKRTFLAMGTQCSIGVRPTSGQHTAFARAGVGSNPFLADSFEASYERSVASPRNSESGKQSFKVH